MSTYTPIASVTLSSAQSSVTFSGIPQTYTDLVLVAATRADTTTFNNMNFPQVQLNGDTGNTYSNTTLYSRNTGGGWSALSTRSSNTDGINSGGVATTSFGSSIFSTYIVNVMNYANTTTNKTVIARVGTGGDLTNMDGTSANVGLWRNTAAVTSLRIVASSSGNFVSGSTFNLYGVANASITNVAKATGGDSVYTDGTYWYHIFNSSGTFTPTQALTADYLVVAGGGGGGENYGGGGGAGGFRTSIGGSGLSCTVQAYTVVVGAGGAGGANGSSQGGFNGSVSSFSTIESAGGGGGGGANNNAAKNGGSGGGGVFGITAGGLGNTPSTSPSQGNNGGASGNLGNGYGGGGGGGAGAVGGTSTGTVGGAGGAGTASSISGTSVTYAGGGGGGVQDGTAGAGGAGGGGAGGSPSGTNTGSPGTANTGGGGGGGMFTQADGGAGGSGIVIVRYAA